MNFQLLALAAREHVAEQFLGLAPVEEVLLVGRALIGVAGRDRHADAELLAEVEERRDVLGRMTVEDRAVDVDDEALGLGGLDAGDRLLEAAFHADGLVVVLLDAVEMDREEQIRRRLEQMQLLLQQQRVGAERDELLARDDAFDDLADLLVDQRLAAGNRDHRRAALVDGVEAFLHRQPPVEDRVRIVDLAAAEAGEIAAEQRLEHQHQRVALATHELLLEQICADAHFL